MRKLSLIILTLILSLGLKAQSPSVAITINSTTQFEVNASFVKNDACQKYSILMATEAEMQGYVSMFGTPLETLIASWGITYTTDSTYTWTDMIPNTEYTVYALAIGATDSVLYQTTATTLSTGSTGVSTISVAVLDITINSVRMICTPDTNTAVFYDGIIRKSYADSLGVDSTVALLLEASAFYPNYETDDWVWQDLEPSTEYYAIAIGKNVLDEWGDTTIVSFATLDNVSLAKEINLEEGIKVYPNPTRGELNYEVNNDYDNLSIYDIKGNLVYTETFKQKQDKLDVSKLNNGIYFLYFSKEGIVGRATKVVIQK